MRLLQVLHHAEDLVVGLAARRARAGSSPSIASVCRNSRPVAALSPCFAERDALVDVARPAPMTSSSRKRLAWRALRATSDMPFLLLSSSSSVAIGR